MSNPTGKRAPNIGVFPQEGEICRVEITAPAAGGRGVARKEGLVWFVAGAVPGDGGEARVLRARGSFVEARLVALDRPSPERIPPPCPLQPRCGGCPWMVLAPASQQRFKRRILIDALARIGGVEAREVEEARRPSRPLGYRNRVEFTVAPGAIGLHAAEVPEEIVDVERCLLQHESANAVLSTARSFLLDPRHGCSGSFRLLIRRSGSSGEIVVGLGEERTPFPHARRLAEHLGRAHPELVGVVRYRARRSGVAGAARSVAGRGWIRERIGGVDFRVPATTFTQVSGAGAEQLARIVTGLAGDVRGADAFDLYGGIGVYAFALTRLGARRVTVCEADAGAVRCGERAARGEHGGRIGFVHADVRSWLAPSGGSGRGVDLVVANPPRSGLGRGVGAAIREHAPRRVILVSCDPATLARDLRGFVGSDYVVTRVVPVDLFPQTPHVEAVVRLDRAS